jgi:hypothetical protein
MTIFRIKFDNKDIYKVDTKFSEKSTEIYKKLILLNEILNNLKEHDHNNLYYSNYHPYNLKERLHYQGGCCLGIFKKIIYSELIFEKFISKQVKEEIIYDYSIRKLSPKTFGNEQFLIMLNIKSQNNKINKINILKSNLYNINKEILQIINKKTSNHIEIIKNYFNKIKKKSNFRVINLEESNPFYEEHLILLKVKNYPKELKKSIVNYIAIINRDILILEQNIDMLNLNNEFIKIISIEENKKKYLNSKLFVFLLPTFFIINYIFILFLFRKDKFI